MSDAWQIGKTGRRELQEPVKELRVEVNKRSASFETPPAAASQDDGIL